MTREDEARELLADLTPPDRLYVQFADSRITNSARTATLPALRKWSSEPFDGAIEFALTRPSSPASVEVERLIEQAKMWLADFDDDRRDMQLEHDHAERFRSILAALTVPARPVAGDDTDWHCGVCMCRTYARVDELKADNKFHPSNIVRCVGCKATHLLPLPTARADIGEAQVIDLDAIFWESIKQAAAESKWIPREHYFMNDWVSDCCDFLRNGPADIGKDAVEGALRIFNGGIVRVGVAESENPRGYIDYYRPKEAMRAALASLQSSGRDAGEEQ